jgi:hypothetical protein
MTGMSLVLRKAKWGRSGRGANRRTNSALSHAVFLFRAVLNSGKSKCEMKGTRVHANSVLSESSRSSSAHRWKLGVGFSRWSEKWGRRYTLSTLFREYSQTSDKGIEGDSVLLLLMDTKFRNQYAACLSAAWGLGGRFSVKTALTAFNDFEAPLNHGTGLEMAPLRTR